MKKENIICLWKDFYKYKSLCWITMRKVNANSKLFPSTFSPGNYPHFFPLHFPPGIVVKIKQHTFSSVLFFLFHCNLSLSKNKKQKIIKKKYMPYFV